MYRIIGSDQKEYGPIGAEQVRQWITQGRIHAESLVKLDGGTEWKPLNGFAEFASAAQPPMPAGPESDSTISTIIPYKNPAALFAYYAGVFSFIPLLGFFLGVAAFILGVMGLKKARQHPEAKGKVHAWIGIILGGFFGLLYLVLGVMLLNSIANRHR